MLGEASRRVVEERPARPGERPDLAATVGGREQGGGACSGVESRPVLALEYADPGSGRELICDRCAHHPCADHNKVVHHWRHSAPEILSISRENFSQKAISADDPLGSWKLTAASALLYTLAFNLIFFHPGAVPGCAQSLRPRAAAHALSQQSQLGRLRPAGELVSRHRGIGDISHRVRVRWCSSDAGGADPPRAVCFSSGWLTTGSLSRCPRLWLETFVPANDVGRAMEYLGLSTACENDGCRGCFHRACRCLLLD